MAKSFIKRAYPEIQAGEFTHVDGTVQFYTRVNALLTPNSKVLELGAGRGAWQEQTKGTYAYNLRLLRGKVREVVGQDIDAAVSENSSVDRHVVTRPGESLPFPDADFDLIVADFVLEHVANPLKFSEEVRRLLKPGGWFCARTPNKWGYVSLLASLVNNTRHASVLRHAQPARNELDIFPTRYKMNTNRDLRRYFPPSNFQHCTYFYQPEPAYHFDSAIVFSLMRTVDRLLPDFLWGNVFVFLQRR